MALALRDYQVTFTREETIAELALRWRQAASIENVSEFNIVWFVQEVLAKRLTKKGPLHFDFYDMKPGDEPAFVTFQPLTLHIDHEVWQLAYLGDPLARFIVAHEVGHLVLHDHHAKAFSDESRVNIKFATKECSAEWQANTFASHFLLPDHIVLAYNDAAELARSCSVTTQLASERLEEATEARKPRPKFDGGFCIVCGNFTRRQNGSIECTTCGS